jgi:putative ABC transport system substrate-binding protein
VFVGGGDPVSAGMVASLARPSGNVTGVTLQRDDLVPKRLELLKEVFPKVTGVAFLFNPTDASDVVVLNAIQHAAPTLGVTLHLAEARSPSDFDKIFAAITRERADALICSESPLFNTHRAKVIDFAATRRLPAMYGFSEFVEAGGLMSYAASLLDTYRRAATYVDRILKGAQPADLPVEQPTRFEFVVNLRTAKQIGATIPPNVLARADKVIK